MKTIENVTIYKCDFCKKELKRKHSMILHEENCINNPQNYRACMNGCKFLERDKIDIDYETYYDYETEEQHYRNIEVNSFRCSKFDKIMYPFKIEKSNALKKYPKTFEFQESMPKQCDSFDNSYDNDFIF